MMCTKSCIVKSTDHRVI